MNIFSGIAAIIFIILMFITAPIAVYKIVTDNTSKNYTQQCVKLKHINHSKGDSK